MILVAYKTDAHPSMSAPLRARTGAWLTRGITGQRMSGPGGRLRRLW